MEIQIWELVVIILIVLLLGGMLAFIFVSLVPLINQLKRTAQQLEITASSLDKVINNELKAVLNQGETVLEKVEELQPIIKDKVRHIPSATAQFAFSEVGGRMVRAVAFWALREAWAKIRRSKK